MAIDPKAFIHEKAYVEESDIGPGTRVWAFACITKGAKLGADCNVCSYAFLERGTVVGNKVTIKNGVQIFECVTIEDEVFLGPNMVFTNDMNPRVGFKKKLEEYYPTLVKKGASIGANATIVCGTTIGEHAFVGAGSVVTKNVAPYAMVAGNPAKHIGWMCTCGKKLKEPYACECGRKYRMVSKEKGLESI